MIVSFQSGWLLNEAFCLRVSVKSGLLAQTPSKQGGGHLWAHEAAGGLVDRIGVTRVLCRSVPEIEKRSTPDFLQTAHFSKSSALS
jgi:hypothetical protein